MHIDNQYEKLVKNGYVESGNFIIQVDDITKLQLNQEEVKNTNINQATRQDKGVVVIDKQGRMKKISSLMIGYNKHNIKLADGNFANSDDLLEAMQKAINNLEVGTIVVNQKGQVLNPQELLGVVKDAAGKIKIGARSEKITNQDSRHWSIEGAKSNKEYQKGIAFLGNEGIDLKKGDYVSVDELLIALNEYMIMKPKDPQISKQPEEQKQSNKIRVTRKYKNKLSQWLILLATIATLLSGFRLKDNFKIVDIPVNVQNQIVQMIEKEQATYGINELTTEFTYETIQEAQRRIISGLKIGDEVKLHTGDELFETSELKGRKAVIGKSSRQEGNYQISGISILCNGRIYNAHVDLSIKNPGFEIGKFINETCSKYNLDLNQLEIRLHMGNSANFTRTGWIDITKLIKEDTIEQQVVAENTVIASSYDGQINDFKGEPITIETLDGQVTINVVDSNGNLLKAGTKIVGSDGKEYIINNLSVDTIQQQEVRNVTTTIMEQKQVEDGKKLTWRIQDCSLSVAIAPLLGAIVAERSTRKKNREEQANPKFFEFETEEQYIKFKKDFEEAKEKYEQTSNFKKMLKELFYRKEVDLLQRLTEEQVQQIYAVIKKRHDKNFSYRPNDKIEFKNGRIIITEENGRTTDITNIVMSSINDIGRENEIVTEGRLEEGQKNGVYRR